MQVIPTRADVPVVLTMLDGLTAGTICLDSRCAHYTAWGPATGFTGGGPDARVLADAGRGATTTSTFTDPGGTVTFRTYDDPTAVYLNMYGEVVLPRHAWHDGVAYLPVVDTTGPEVRIGVRGCTEPSMCPGTTRWWQHVPRVPGHYYRIRAWLVIGAGRNALLVIDSDLGLTLAAS